jgi:hypothetical protein
MSSNEYHFITHWRVQSTVREVMKVLGDAKDLARWWPSVYLDVKELKPGDEHGVGGEISLYTKGYLPYTLRWDFRVAEVKPGYLRIEAKGDFVGRGIWTLTQDGDWVNITYDWKISAEKPLLKTWSFLLKPFFKVNHFWAMAQGEKSLKLELARRHAKNDHERAAIPAPPPATSTSTAPLAVLRSSFGFMGYLLSRQASRN